MTQSSEVYIILFHNALHFVKIIKKEFDSSVQTTIQVKDPMYPTAQRREQGWHPILIACCTQAPKLVAEIVREEA